MYPVTTPLNKWFEYRAWLEQNYMFPMSEYFARPSGDNEMTINFLQQTNQQQFIDRWQHTF